MRTTRSAHFQLILQALDKFNSILAGLLNALQNREAYVTPSLPPPAMATAQNSMNWFDLQNVS